MRFSPTYHQSQETTMVPLNMKTCLALLWGISVLFSTESISAPIPETSSNSTTAGPDQTAEPLITVVQTDPVTWHPTHKPAEVGVSATAQITFPPTLEMEEAIVTDSSDSSNDSTTGVVATSTVAATASTSGPRLLHTFTAVTTAAGEPQRSHNTTNSETPETTEHHLHQESPEPSSVMTSSSATTSTAPLATETASSPQPTPTTEPEVTSNSSSTTSPAGSTQTPVFIHDLSSPSATTTSTMTTNPTSQAPVFDPTSSSFVTISETSNTSAELSSTSQPASMMRTHRTTSEFITTAGSSSPSEPPTISFSTDSAISTTARVSTSPAGIFIPNVSKRLPVPTTKSIPATTMTSKITPSTEVQPCSTRGVAKQCLIAITSLAGLATIFMVCTIVLCTKLSARKYKVKKPQPATEMMCISALLPERNYTYRRQRNPVSNGVLVIHGGGDSDDDGGDNLTLSSFLPENDRVV